MPEGRCIFPSLTVWENLTATSAPGAGPTPRWTTDAILDLFPWIRERRNQMGGQLSGGEQQMLAIARALMTNPELLILDEATEGLAPIIRQEIWKVLRKLKAAGQSILIVDKNLKVLARLADRHYVLERGRVRWSGDSASSAPNMRPFAASSGSSEGFGLAVPDGAGTISPQLAQHGLRTQACEDTRMTDGRTRCDVSL